MSQPGYHPICVLFQGNDCAFDGTYRLVCRHQVRQTDFQPGDNVEVDMGDDDEDAQEGVEVVSAEGDGRRWRDAIALGDEMVMSLLRNMCKTQPSGKSPWGSDSREARKRRNTDRKGDTQEGAKRIKTEECTTSHGTTNSVESQHSESLQKILSAINSMKSANNLVQATLNSIQQRQEQLSEQMAAIHTRLSHMEGDVNDSLPGPSDDISDGVTPVSLFAVSQPPDSSPQARRVVYSGVQQPSLSPNGSASPSHSQSQILMSNPSQSHAEPSSFTSPESGGDLAMQQTLPPLYPIETSYSHPQVLYQFRYTDESKLRVYLGYPNSPLVLFKSEMDEILVKTNTPSAFAYRLAGKIFSKEELLTSNTSGKSNKKTGRTYRQLNIKYVNIILMEVETRFPTCRNTRESTKRLFGAINERCRNERKKIMYRFDGSGNTDTGLLTKKKSTPSK